MLCIFLAALNPAVGRYLRRDSFLAAALAFFIVFIFVAITAYGAELTLRAIRGHSPPRSERSQAWYLRHWYALTLANCGVLAGVGMAMAGGPKMFLLNDGALFRIYWFASLAFLILPIHVAIHELGHAAVGTLVKFRFEELRVGWLVVRREGGRFRLSWVPTGFGQVLGLHSALPQTEQAIGARFALVCAGGPAASIALAAMFRAASTTLQPEATLSFTLASQLLSVGWWVGVYLAVISLLPAHIGSGLITDGAHILRVLHSRSPAEKIMRFVVLWQQGRRPRDWGMSPQSILNAITLEVQDPEALLLAALCVALDVGDREHVDEILGRIAEMEPETNSMWQIEIELQTIMIEAFRGNAAVARARFDRLDSHTTLPDYPRLAEAAVQMAEGRPTKARACLDAWHHFLTKTENAAAIRVGNEWAVEALEARLARVAESNL